MAKRLLTVRNEKSTDVDVAAMGGDEERDFRSLGDPGALLFLFDDAVEAGRIKGVIGGHAAIQQLIDNEPGAVKGTVERKRGVREREEGIRKEGGNHQL